MEKENEVQALANWLSKNQETLLEKWEKQMREDGGDTFPTGRHVATHGEGIGLLIVRHLCRLLDASVEVDTQQGKGTTFKIIFPLDFSE